MEKEIILNLKDSDFDMVIKDTAGPILVDFWADWCSPCKMIAPLVGEIAEEFMGKIRVGKLNVDENRETPAKLKVQSIPTLVVFKDGQELERIVGFRTKEELRRALLKYAG